MTKSPMSAEPVRKLRCAACTRKSTEEGPEMEVDSLDTPRGAGEADIASDPLPCGALVLGEGASWRMATHGLRRKRAAGARPPWAACGRTWFQSRRLAARGRRA